MWPAFNGALDLADDRFDGTHVRHRGKRNEAVAHPAKFGERVVIGPDAVKLELRVAVEESATRSVGKQNFGIDPVPVQRFEATRGIVNFQRHFLPALWIVAPLFHRRRTITNVAALNLAVDDPALDRKRKLVFPHLDQVWDFFSPLLLGHAACIGVLAKLAVRIGTDQTEFYFHSNF